MSIKTWLKSVLGISDLEKEVEDLDIYIQSMELKYDSLLMQYRDLENKVYNMDLVFKECVSVSADIHLKSPATQIMVAGKLRGKDFVKLYEIDHKDLSEIKEHLEHLENN